MKRITILLCTFLLTFTAALVNAASSTKMPAATGDFFVNDFAGVLSDETKQYIMQHSQAAAQNHDNLQIVVATVESMGGLSVEEYALDLFRTWKIGNGKKNNGMLILLSTGDRRLRMEDGYGLEGDINDAKAGRLMDEYAIPYLRDNQFDEGIRSLYQAVLAELGILDEAVDPPDDEDGLGTILTIVFAIVLVLVIGYFNGRGGGRRGSGRHSYYYGSYGIHHTGSNFRSGGSPSGGGFYGGGGSSGGGGASRGF